MEVPKIVYLGQHFTYLNRIFADLEDTNAFKIFWMKNRDSCYRGTVGT
jgi:hypothetical protein